MWIIPLQAIVNNNNIEIYAPNKFIIDYICKNYLIFIKKIIFSLCKKKNFFIKFFIGNKYIKNNNIVYKNLSFGFIKFNNCFLLKKFNFNNFICGNSNKLAYIESFNICKFSNKSYKTLLLYSKTGLGKTHLLNSIGNRINNIYKLNKKVIYITSEFFVNKMVKSIYNNSIENFRLFFKSADILLIDDFQFFSKKKHSQEEFFYILDYFMNKNKLIVLTSNKNLKNIKNINDRLISRLLCGLVLSIKNPEFKIRFEFLLKKSKEMKILLKENIIEFIANKIKNNIYELEGILHLLFTNANYLNCLSNISIDFVKNILYDFIKLNEEKIIIYNIQKIVSNYYKLSVYDLLSKSRFKYLVFPRQMSIAISKKITNYSLSELGKFFGGLDHSTILYSCKKINKLCNKNINVKYDFNYLIKIILKIKNEIYYRKRKNIKTIK